MLFSLREIVGLGDLPPGGASCWLLLKGDCPVFAAAGLPHRVLVRLRARCLDRGLAAGAWLDASLALHARRLVDLWARRDPARTTQRLLAAAKEPRAAGRLPVLVCRDRVRRCLAEPEELISRLFVPGPVYVRGVTHVRALFTDAISPLYRASPDALGASIRAAVHDLNPPPRTPGHLWAPSSSATSPSGAASSPGVWRSRRRRPHAYA